MSSADLMSREWTAVADLVPILRRRWDRGQYLRPYAAGEPFVPIVLAVKAPTAQGAVDDLEGAVAWANRFRRDSHTPAGRPRFMVEYRTIKGQGLGVNKVPARVRVETFEQLCSLLGTAEDVRVLDTIIEHTKAAVPALADWVIRKPGVALEHRAIWTDALGAVKWIAEHDTSRLYVRHLDVPGVDTKFVERHQQLLSQLLRAVLPTERVQPGVPTFARRYGFLAKPTYTRIRALSPLPGFPRQVTEMHLRTDELAAIEVPVSTVFVVENEVTYLAFPTVPDAIVVFGEGFASITLDALPWLKDKDVVYWGDIDTHGFVILNRLRGRLPKVASLLMDRETLLAHREQFVTEPNPTAARQPFLTYAEQSLYLDLIEDRFGHNVRLEQERVRFSLLRQALQPWLDNSVR